MTETSKEGEVVLQKVLCIHYPLCFQKNRPEVKTLINFGSKINVIILGYISKLGLKICHTNIKAWKIDGFIVKTFRMDLTSFQV